MCSIPLRELQTKKQLNKTVVHKNTKGETRTVHLTVEGPVSIASCTTREKLYEDNANRSFLIYIDESKEQDERIMAYQRKLSAGKIDLAEEEKIRQQFRNMQRIILPVTVRNPCAEQLKSQLKCLNPAGPMPITWPLLKAVTFYHQYQRKSNMIQKPRGIYRDHSRRYSRSQ